jgi:hypothetical protein
MVEDVMQAPGWGGGTGGARTCARWRRQLRRLAALLLLSAGSAACVAPKPPAPPPNPFLGDWATQDNDRITFRTDTVVQDQKEGPPTALGPGTCAGVFHFAYDSKSRDALVALVPDQPEMRQRLSALLAAPSYEVAELACDRGDQTYVLIGDGRLVAIYRDGTIAAIERFSRI